MRFSLATLCLAISAICAPFSAISAQAESYLEARTSARRALEIAKIELRTYLQVEYPRERRYLDAQITLTNEEVRAYKERLREYRPFDRFSTGRPLLVTIQDLRLCLLEAELRLKDLYAERNALLRYHSDHWRLLELEAQAARLRVVELEAGDVAVAEHVDRQP